MRPKLRLSALAKGTIFLLGCLIFIFVVLQGLSAILLAALELRQDLRTSWNDICYDPELGWARIPNTTFPDRFGPGKSETFNSQGFRNLKNFAIHAQNSKIRVICLGDSFTFGFGVDDRQTWCHRLEDQDQRLETINMGQIGYGLDQAFLWYQRDGAKLEHHAQIFAFITDDLRRMTEDRFYVYAKPLLKLSKSELIVENVPVPRSTIAELVAGIRFHFSTLPSQHLLGVISRKIYVLRNRRPPESSIPLPKTDIFPILSRIFEELARSNRAHGSTLMLVYIPELVEYSNLSADDLRSRVRAEAERQQILFLDLVEEVRKLSPKAVAELYITCGDEANHLTVAGNEWVARAIYAELASAPGFALSLNQSSRRQASKDEKPISNTQPNRCSDRG
jgi:hypothetical protein